LDSLEIIVPALKAYAPVTDIVKKRIYQASSIDHHPERPFLVLRKHTRFPIASSIGDREYLQLWAHDEPGSYTTHIDPVLEAAAVCLEHIVLTGLLLEIRWIETGVYLRDDQQDTITRYSRFQLTSARRSLHG